jgi:hypothetical protein
MNTTEIRYPILVYPTREIKMHYALTLFLTGAFLITALSSQSTIAQESRDSRLPISGKSFGGAFRQGPSMDTRQIGSIRERAPVTIMKNAGNEMNGFDWFQIRFKGRTGYQWGGILCSKSKVKGIYQTCDEAGY